MFNLNSDGSASPYATQQFNPWNNGLGQPLGHAGIQAWQQQLALQQLLAQQMSNAPQWGATQHRVQQIAQLLHSLAQQLLQLASQGNQFNAQPLPLFQLGQVSPSQGQFPVQMGQQFAQPAQPFAQPPQHLGLH
jgi:hypothetical protein